MKNSCFFVNAVWQRLTDIMKMSMEKLSYKLS